MSGITLAQAEAQLAAYLAAETAILTGAQSYEVAGRSFRKADLAAVQAGVKLWQERVAQLAARVQGRGRAVSVVMRG
jgi:hypothetical protein